MNLPRTGSRSVSWVSLATAFLFLTGCALDDRQSTFDVHGPVSAVQYDVFKVTLWVSVGIFAVVGSLLLVALVRFRHGGEVAPETPLPPQTHGSTPLELGLTLASIALLGVIAVPTLRGIFQTAAPPRPADALVVKVTGHQWWWSIEYPESRVVTANELCIPVDRPVLIHLESADVIHSFWIPKLAGKVDVIPNQHNEMWLQADVPGMWWGQCAEFCGTSHANMRLRAVSLSPQDFTSWLKRQKLGAESPSTALARDGQAIFVRGPRVGMSCATCHTIQGMPAAGTIGPNLTHFATRSTMAAGLLDNNDANVSRWLSDVEQVKPGNKMSLAGLRLDTREVQALTAFLRTLR